MATDNKPAFTQIRPFEKYGEMSAAELGAHLQRLPPEEATKVIASLPESRASAALAEIQPDNAGELLNGLPPPTLAALFAHMPPNHAADFIVHLTPALRREVLSVIPAEASAQITALLHYPPHTAGGIMSNRFIALRADQTVGECQDMLRAREQEKTEDVSYLYVIDAARKLLGVITLRDLVFRRHDRKIEEIMSRDVTSLRVDDDQEKIARVFEERRYLGLPVLEQDGTLVGVVPASEVIEIVQDEATEDMQLMVGLSGEERVLTPWQKSLKPRLLWLNINLFTAFAAGAVVNVFESTIAKWTVLAVFLPIIAGQGGNAGAQTLTVIIRGLATGEITPGDGRKALIKELILGVLNGLAIGAVVGFLGFLWKGSIMLGVIVSIAMVLNMLAAAVAGVMVPYVLKALKIDPALASSIIVTTVTDVAGFFFFLGLAAMAMSWCTP